MDGGTIIAVFGQIKAAEMALNAATSEAAEGEYNEAIISLSMAADACAKAQRLLPGGKR